MKFILDYKGASFKAPNSELKIEKNLREEDYKDYPERLKDDQRDHEERLKDLKSDLRVITEDENTITFSIGGDVISYLRNELGID